MRRSIGKGLSHLITERFEGTSNEVAIDAIAPNKRQPRTRFEDAALVELAASIREHGILQPLLVRPAGDAHYELIAGERRLRAAKQAGLTRVPIIVRTSTAQESLELALIENLQREDIGPLECASAYKRLSDEFGLTQDQIAERVGKARASVTNTLRLLKLPTRIQDGLRGGLITEGHARALLMIEHPAAQIALFDRIVKYGLSVRDVESAAREPERTVPNARPIDPNWEALEESVAKRLGSPVAFQRKSGGGGKMIVSFYSDDDLERILSSLGLSG